MPGIKGYRELSKEELELINNIKDEEITLGELWTNVNQYAEVDKRWMAIAKTHFEEGFMAFVRAIAKPDDRFTA